MGRLRLWISMSLDGFVAGPDQDAANPLGVGGMRLHEWVFPLAVWREPQGLEGGDTNESTPVVEASMANIGATVMGRNMFGGGTGPWGDDPWKGWWGDDPPYHHPVFVLTHHPREPLVCKGGTTFTFVTDGIESALDQARAAANPTTGTTADAQERDISLAGGANAARQYLEADLVDEMAINLVPIFLGDGERLFDNLGRGNPRLAHVATVPAPGVIHLRFERA
jgi:dihydrofolate reductase